MTTWLLDTGPAVAYLDPRDTFHQAVASSLDSFTGQLVTTSAVITETMYFLGSVAGGPALLAELVASSGMHIHDFSQALELREAVLRMDRYRDIPMDYADATLVLLAERLDVLEIFTLDRRGFAAFRTSEGAGFTNVLDLQ